MAKDLEGKRVAIVVTNGFEQVELTEPRQALEEAGASTDIVEDPPRRTDGSARQPSGATAATSTG